MNTRMNFYTARRTLRAAGYFNHEFPNGCGLARFEPSVGAWRVMVMVTDTGAGDGFIQPPGPGRAVDVGIYTADGDQPLFMSFPDLTAFVETLSTLAVVEACEHCGALLDAEGSCQSECAGEPGPLHGEW